MVDSSQTVPSYDIISNSLMKHQHNADCHLKKLFRSPYGTSNIYNMFLDDPFLSFNSETILQLSKLPIRFQPSSETYIDDVKACENISKSNSNVKMETLPIGAVCRNKYSANPHYVNYQKEYLDSNAKVYYMRPLNLQDSLSCIYNNEIPDLKLDPGVEIGLKSGRTPIESQKTIDIEEEGQIKSIKIDINSDISSNINMDPGTNLYKLTELERSQLVRDSGSDKKSTNKTLMSQPTQPLFKLLTDSQDDMTSFDYSFSHIYRMISSRYNSVSIIKLTNIPWEISTWDIRNFFKKYQIPDYGIHIPIDRESGKTKNEVFVEFDSKEDIVQAMILLHRKPIRGREILITYGTVEDMLKVHFPSLETHPCVYISKAEIASIINICRYYKIHFSRKCASRPFEHVISIIKLLPWDIIPIQQRNSYFELIKQSMLALVGYIFKQNSQFSTSLLISMAECADKYAILTEEQRGYIYQICDLVHNKQKLTPDSLDVMSILVLRKSDSSAIPKKSIDDSNSKYDSDKTVANDDHDVLNMAISQLNQTIVSDIDL